VLMQHTKLKEDLKLNIGRGVSNKKIVIRNQTPTSNNPILNLLVGHIWRQDKSQIKIEAGLSVLPYSQKRHITSRDVANVKIAIGYQVRPRWVVSGVLGYKFHDIKELNVSDEKDELSLGLQDQNNQDIKKDVANLCAGIEVQYQIKKNSFITGNIQYAFPFSTIQGLFRVVKKGDHICNENGTRAECNIHNTLSFVRFTLGFMFDLER